MNFEDVLLVGDNETLGGTAAKFMLFPLFSIEDFLNGKCTEHESARLKRLNGKAQMLIHTASTAYTTGILAFIALVAVDPAQLTPGTALNSTASYTNLADYLDAVFTNEYQFQLLDKGLVVSRPMFELTQADVADYKGSFITSLQFSYQPPKGDIGLMESDEHLSEDNIRTFLVMGTMAESSMDLMTFKPHANLDVQYEIRQNIRRILGE